MHPVLMAAGTLINTGRGQFALFVARAPGEGKPAVAIAALDEVGPAHLQPDPGVTQRPADPVAGHAPGADDQAWRLPPQYLDNRGAGEASIDSAQAPTGVP